MSWGIHVAYVSVILVLIVLVLAAFRANSNNGTALLRVNCVVAEMFFDEARYGAVRQKFLNFIDDERRPIEQHPSEKADFEANRLYWISSAFQIEKATQTLMVSDSQEYLGLAKAVHRYATR